MTKHLLLILLVFSACFGNEVCREDYFNIIKENYIKKSQELTSFLKKSVHVFSPKKVPIKVSISKDEKFYAILMQDGREFYIKLFHYSSGDFINEFKKNDVVDICFSSDNGKLFFFTHGKFNGKRVFFSYDVEKHHVEELDFTMQTRELFLRENLDFLEEIEIKSEKSNATEFFKIGIENSKTNRSQSVVLIFEDESEDYLAVGINNKIINYLDLAPILVDGGQIIIVPKSYLSFEKCGDLKGIETKKSKKQNGFIFVDSGDPVSDAINSIFPILNIYSRYEELFSTCSNISKIVSCGNEGLINVNDVKGLFNSKHELFLWDGFKNFIEDIDEICGRLIHFEKNVDEGKGGRRAILFLKNKEGGYVAAFKPHGYGSKVFGLIQSIIIYELSILLKLEGVCPHGIPGLMKNTRHFKNDKKERNIYGLYQKYFAPVDLSILSEKDINIFQLWKSVFFILLVDLIDLADQNILFYEHFEGKFSPLFFDYDEFGAALEWQWPVEWRRVTHFESFGRGPHRGIIEWEETGNRKITPEMLQKIHDEIVESWDIDEIESFFRSFKTVNTETEEYYDYIDESKLERFGRIFSEIKRIVKRRLKSGKMFTAKELVYIIRPELSPHDYQIE